jgi:hypothetical protein
MTILKQTIVAKFLGNLAEQQLLDKAKIEALRRLFAEDSKIKADDLVKLFTGDEDGVA